MGKWFQNKNFTTEKRGQGIKARKGHRDMNTRKLHRDIKAWKLHRAFGILLAAALVFQTVPFEGIAVSASESSGGGLCEHHRSHTPDCGYKEAEPGHGCTHEHTEDCYRTVEGEDGSTTREPDCHHEHDESCGYREAAEGSPCTFVCEICKGGTDRTPEDNGINDGDSENPGTENGDEVKEPDASLSDCKGEDAEENTDQPEDTGLCKHHREHDDACGYLSESEDSKGSPCTYECRICPVERLIAALPDAADITEDNADEVRTQLEEILALYRELTGDEQGQIDLSCVYELQGVLDGANALMLADGHTEQQANDEASVTVDGITSYYATLEEAFAAANGKTATITMLENAECVKSDSAGSPLDITSGNVTLNMNGKTLSGIGYGTYGIINIKGGSLSVQGKGSIEVRRYGISSRGGTLAVTETAFNLTGQDGAYANTGVLNKGGTVIINSGTFSGVSGGLGQIHHESGNTTINHAEMTGTAADNPVGVVYSDKGTLTINGGTFSNITVEENNFVKVNSVAEFLGKGCAFKHQNGTWATDEEMAGKTLDNVTVQKIPLTINPQSETSWYYNSSPHTLAMNAAPVDSGVISYVWKNGTDTLDCTTDNYEIPADMHVGNYTYTCEATCDGYTLSHEFSFEIKQSGTQFVGGGTVKTYKGSAECSDFTADDTITVKAMPTATGAASVKAAVRLRGDPTAGQMVVLVNDKQVSTPADKGADGSYTMTVSAADVLTLGGVEPNQAITLTAKFVGNDNMADAYGTVDVKISAVAKVEKNGFTTYVDAAHFANAIAPANGNNATFTMLQDVMLTGKVNISCSNLVLDLNGHSISVEKYFQIASIYPITIKDSKGGGAMISQTASTLIAERAAGLTIEGGTFRGAGGNTGLYVQSRPIVLAGGTFEGIECVLTTLKEQLKSGYCYYDQNNKPIALTNEQTNLTGTVTVKPCTHDKSVCEYTHAKGTTTHQQTCLACGKIETEETCSYADGKCVCGSTLSVVLTDTEKLVYDGNSHEPGVTVTLDGTELTAADYDITYANNINAGTDTATVTVKGKGNYSFEIEKTFSIEKAEQEDFAVMAVTKQYEKNGTFPLSTTGGGGDGAVLYRVPENNGVLMVKGNTATIIGVGTVTVTATKAESDNYKEAAATGIITIKKASAPAITYPTAGSITYGQKLSDCALIGGSTEYGTFAWKDDSTVPAVGNTTGYAVVFTASEETEKNYESITDTTQKVSVKVEQAVPAVSIVAALSGSKDSRQAVLTVNVAKAGAGAFPTGTVKLIDCTGSTEREIGTVTLNNSGTASYTWDGLQDKAYTIKAVYTGDSNYKEAVSREFTFDAAKQNQKDFSLEAIGAKTYGDTAIPLKTTGGSGSGAVSYKSSDENVIRIEDGRAVIVGAGTATITAIKEGDDNYNEASAGRNVTVAKKALTVKADSKTVVRGNPMPVFTYRADGLVNGDTFTTAPSITAGAQDTDTLGKYDIVIGGGTLRNSGSYRITYVNGTLHIVERIYTVIVTDGTGGGEYAEGDTVTITANERNGYTFTGWSSGDGVAFADGKAKTTTFTMPAKSVTVKANYTRNSSGGNNGGGSGDGGNSGGSGNNSGGGNTGDNGNNGGQGSGGGGSTNPGNGNTTPQVSVLQPADTKTNTNPGNEATPGTGTKQPFIKGEDGKIGWDVIRIEEEQAQEGSTINVDMNGSTVVPGDIFDSIKGKDITITFDMGNGILWSVDGKNITTDKAGDIDFSVKTGVKTVPVDIINNVTGESYSIQLSLAYEGEFGFTAVLSIELGQENAGYTASLYYYNESTGELAFVCADTVAQDGTVSLAFTHASDYVIAIDAEAKEENDTAEAVQTEGTDATAGTDESAVSVPEGLEAGQTGKIWRGILTIVLVTAIGIGAVLVIRKKRE